MSTIGDNALKWHQKADLCKAAYRRAAQSDNKKGFLQKEYTMKPNKMNNWKEYCSVLFNKSENNVFYTPIFGLPNKSTKFCFVPKITGMQIYNQITRTLELKILNRQNLHYNGYWFCYWVGQEQHSSPGFGKMEISINTLKYNK